MEGPCLLFLTCCSGCYAHTRQAVALLEALARCVQLQEHALLVGETGVGKTAAVSYLSSLVGSKLVTLNLSQQSDSFDLLGGLVKHMCIA